MKVGTSQSQRLFANNNLFLGKSIPLRFQGPAVFLSLKFGFTTVFLLSANMTIMMRNEVDKTSLRVQV